MVNEKEKETNTEEKKKVTPETGTTPTEDDGDKEKTTAVLDRADEINQVKTRNLEREEKILARKETLEARKAVGGETEAGSEPVKDTKTSEEKDKEYHDKFLKGEVNPLKDNAE